MLFGVSRDNMASHDKFKQSLELPFELIADTEEKLCHMFGVVKNKIMYGKKVKGIERSTFLIDGSGVLRAEWRGLTVAGHVDEVLKAVKAHQESGLTRPPFVRARRAVVRPLTSEPSPMPTAQASREACVAAAAPTTFVAQSAAQPGKRSQRPAPDANEPRPAGRCSS